VPVFYMNSEKSGDEVLSALGSLSSLSLKSRIRHNSGFAASDTYQLFIAVLVPSGRPGLTGAGIASVPVGADTLFFKNAAANWETYGGGTLPVYISNVAASEVEETLRQHPAVFDAAVVGVPDPVRDQAIKAYVILKEGAAATAEDLRAWCRDRLSAFKVPEAVEFRDAFPRTSVGKIQKHLFSKFNRLMNFSISQCYIRCQCLFIYF